MAGTKIAKPYLRGRLQNLDMVEPELQNLITWKGAKSLGGKAAGYYGKVKGLGLF